MRRRVFQSSREAVARKRKRQRAYKVARRDAGRRWSSLALTVKNVVQIAVAT